ncbi:ASPIC/UnbV [Candidatus Koribacter versatilis Ellin345]|uniref:ASPIC/UnbV n=2 Tax=Candidatus Korobacter versatilis TaxID=658062 RepID=Q1IT88_KORVE|nr:ASPIC/UnbV [Candidatus Koribacter versatilis Ellin345]
MTRFRYPMRLFLSFLAVLLTSGFGQVPGPPAPAKPSIPKFEDIAKKAGVTGSHISSPEQHYIIESMSGGSGLFDCDDDGKLDLLIAGGSTVDRFKQGGDPLVRLYHQDADLKFTDITEAAGLTVKGWGMGVAVADFDNDGILDIYVTGYGRNALYKGLGNCKFKDVTEKAGVAMDGLNAGAAWGDYDKDGNVDLFVSRYVHLDINNLPSFGSDERFCRFKGVLVQCGPWGMQGESDKLFHNRGDGTFEEVSKKAGVDDPKHRYGLGAIWTDYDNDGWPDLYLANDAGPNFLYHNNHNGTFEEVGLVSGVALSDDGQELGSMGVDSGDYDHDGNFDIFVTNFTDQPDNLYHNLGNKSFTDMAWASGLGQGSFSYVKWGTGFVDFDNDGWPDVFVANGHVYPQVDAIPGSPRYRERMQLFQNLQNGTFKDISEGAGLNAIPEQSRRGAAFGDINNDGNVDILLQNIGEPPNLLINQTQNSNHRVIFKLVGTKSNRAAIGARITVISPTLKQMNEVRSGASYLSMNDLRVHFGLGADDKMTTVEIWWPTGKKEVLRDVPGDFIYEIVEDQGIRKRTQLPPVAGATSTTSAAESPKQ